MTAIGFGGPGAITAMAANLAAAGHAVDVWKRTESKAADLTSEPLVWLPREARGPGGAARGRASLPTGRRRLRR